MHLAIMLALPRIRLHGVPFRVVIQRMCARVTDLGGLAAPLCFIVFGVWGSLLGLPAYRALRVGVSLTDSISTIENGVNVLRPVWQIALPGVTLALLGLLGALWSFVQHRLPLDRDPAPLATPDPRT